MKQLSTILILCLLITISSEAQRNTPESMLTGLRISTNLVTLKEPDGGVSLALEYRYKKNWSVLMEGTWIFIDEKADYNIRGRYTPMAKGFRIRPEIRYYVPGRGQVYKLFFAQEISYKRVSYLEEWIQPVKSNPSGWDVDYEQISAYEKVKNIYGTAGKVGCQLFFDRSHKFMIEFYIGLGLKYRDVAFKNKVPSADSYLEDNSSYLADVPKTGWDINVPMGIKVGYRF
ncbi:DUF3575 domain-containing protein [Chitinophaga filiformis]|uniref:DUF3575 domain-containing protein n=1 Tax=Chitinophaga filiformis TaxID=104663 RepID=A0A1G7R6Z0_CHIFI|nr:DUF3575 domain-containing protein [Chitinophaga filiformis]SDG06513.1 hypothetical protein SAMN04488121_103347 [Chitinophaga filiformis]